MAQNSTISNNLQKVIAERLGYLSRTLQRTFGGALKEKTIRAFVEDIEDMLQDTFEGLHADLEEVLDIAENTTAEAWDTEFKNCTEVFLLLKDYGDLLKLFYEADTEHKHPTGAEDMPGEIYGTSRQGMEQNQRISSAALYTFLLNHEDRREDILDRAAIFRHIFLIMWIAVADSRSAFANYSADPGEIIPITPIGCTEKTALTLQQKNAENIEQVQRQRSLFEQRKARAKDREGEQLINTMQNTADMLSRSLNTADMSEDGQALITRPLLQALTEKKARAKQQAIESAEGLKEELQGKALEEWAEEQAAAMVPSATYVMQALRGAVVISNLEKPIADGSEKATYRMNLLRLTQHCTGQQSPNKKQMQNTWLAWCFLSTQQTEFIEYRQVGTGKKKRSRKGRPADAEAAPADSVQYTYAPYKVRTNPATATFVQPLQEGQEYSGTTEVFVDIHHIITEGRRQEVVMIDGKKAYIKAPVQHLNSLQQLYEFSSPAEIHFYGCMLSKSHIMEEVLLAEMYDYKNRLKNCATEEERKKEKRNQQKNKGRDREALQDMFIRAKQTGLIAWYSRQETIDRSTGKAAYSWKWGRPEGQDKKE